MKNLINNFFNWLFKNQNIIYIIIIDTLQFCVFFFSFVIWLTIMLYIYNSNYEFNLINIQIKCLRFLFISVCILSPLLKWIVRKKVLKPYNQNKTRYWLIPLSYLFLKFFLILIFLMWFFLKFNINLLDCNLKFEFIFEIKKIWKPTI